MTNRLPGIEPPALEAKINLLESRPSGLHIILRRRPAPRLETVPQSRKMRCYRVGPPPGRGHTVRYVQFLALALLPSVLAQGCGGAQPATPAPRGRPARPAPGA